MNTMNKILFIIVVMTNLSMHAMDHLGHLHKKEHSPMHYADQDFITVITAKNQIIGQAKNLQENPLASLLTKKTIAQNKINLLRIKDEPLRANVALAIAHLDKADKALDQMKNEVQNLPLMDAFVAAMNLCAQELNVIDNMLRELGT